MLGVYLLSQPDVYLTRADAMQLLLCLDPPGSKHLAKLPPLPMPAVMRKGELPGTKVCFWTGKQLLSLVIPRSQTRETEHLVIRRGELLVGQLDKKVLGMARGSLLHHVLLDEPRGVGQAFIERLADMARVFLDLRGFTVG